MSLPRGMVAFGGTSEVATGRGGRKWGREREESLAAPWDIWGLLKIQTTGPEDPLDREGGAARFPEIFRVLKSAFS